MTRAAFALSLLAAAGAAAWADEPSPAAVKKLAQEIGDATLKGDYAKVIDYTYDGIVKKGGGKEAATKAAGDAMKQLARQGVKLKSFTAGDPGEFVTDRGTTFVVVPTTLEMMAPMVKVVAKSYLLGISADGGKTWKFAEGAGVSKADFDGTTLPKLPAKLKLPEKQKPQITKAD
jgi:hypothetical protein